MPMNRIGHLHLHIAVSRDPVALDTYLLNLINQKRQSIRKRPSHPRTAVPKMAFPMHLF